MSAIQILKPKHICCIVVSTVHHEDSETISKDSITPRKAQDGSGRDPIKFPLVLENFRGKRQVCGVKIETYIPEKERQLFRGGFAKGASSNMDVDNVEHNEKENLSAEKDQEVRFIAGDPYVETFQGILHIFKEEKLTEIDDAGMRSQTVCILAVPAKISHNDLLTFLAARRSDVKSVRIISDASLIRYMALITFSSSESVIEFYKSLDGKPFTSLNPEWCCHLVFVSLVEIVDEGNGGSIPPISHTELPSCPVCLERMDEPVNGILTILRDYTFHGSSLLQLDDPSCPVCQYVRIQRPNMENHCFKCLATESLWICLICGHVGCGRYLQGHANDHYIDTHHCFSMQVGTNSVWDYVRDKFVHRILQNRIDVKYIESPNSEKPYEIKEKIYATQLEYICLFTSQQETQRAYYEEMVASIKRTFDAVMEENVRLSDLVQKCKKEKARADKKYESLVTSCVLMQKALLKEKELNAALVKSQSLWKQKLFDLEIKFSKLKIQKSIELDEVKDQLRDITFHMNAKKKVSVIAEKNEIMGGTIELPERVPPSEEKKRRFKRQRRN